MIITLKKNVDRDVKVHINKWNTNWVCNRIQIPGGCNRWKPKFQFIFFFCCITDKFMAIKMKRECSEF
jgi:hypothetical protein